jgi:hypothetical protein
MPIILAIEPDRRQAAHLAGVVRHRVAAELIIADTTEGALDAIGNRVPDMVLVPALLSPQDDAALAAALRVIAAAAHVRTLTIPVLAVGQKRSTTGGMLAKWRGRAASPEPEGCDPAVFAEQINAYLKEAAAERAELALAESDAFDASSGIEAAPMRDLPPAKPLTRDPFESFMSEPLTNEPPVVERLAVAPEVFEPVMVEPAMVEPLIVEPLMAEPLMAEPLMAEPLIVEPLMVEPIAEPLIAEPWAAEALMAAPETIESAVVESATDERAMVEFGMDEELEAPAESIDPWSMNLLEEPVFDLSEALDDISHGASKDLFAVDSFGVYTIKSAVEEPAVEALEAYAALPTVHEDSLPQPIAAHVVEAARFEEADEAAPRRTDESRRTDFEPWAYLTPGRMWPPLEGMLAESATPKSEHLEWAELVASLRQDLERRRMEPQSASIAPVAAASPDAGETRGNRPMNKQKHQARKSRAIQDEWGFFDPEQCGFSALLAKLEEITDAPGESDVRQQPS